MNNLIDFVFSILMDPSISLETKEIVYEKFNSFLIMYKLLGGNEDDRI